MDVYFSRFQKTSLIVFSVFWCLCAQVQEGHSQSRSSRNDLDGFSPDVELAMSIIDSLEMQSSGMASALIYIESLPDDTRHDLSIRCEEARIAGRMGFHGHSLDLWEAILEDDPSNYLALGGMSTQMMYMSMFSNGIESFEMARTVHPDSGSYSCSLGEWYDYLGKKKKSALAYSHSDHDHAKVYAVSSLMPNLKSPRNAQRKKVMRQLAEMAREDGEIGMAARLAVLLPSSKYEGEMAKHIDRHLRHFKNLKGDVVEAAWLVETTFELYPDFVSLETEAWLRYCQLWLLNEFVHSKPGKWEEMGKASLSQNEIKKTIEGLESIENDDCLDGWNIMEMALEESYYNLEQQWYSRVDYVEYKKPTPGYEAFLDAILGFSNSLDYLEYEDEDEWLYSQMDMDFEEWEYEYDDKSDAIESFTYRLLDLIEPLRAHYPEMDYRTAYIEYKKNPPVIVMEETGFDDE